MQTVSTTQFRRDVKLAQRRNKNMQVLKEVIELLLAEPKLDARFRDHSLGGTWKHHRECHLEPDWLLIYKRSGDEIFLVRTGSHADLF